MSDIDHILERRADALASALDRRVEMLGDALAPKGQRPPFTEQLSKQEALNWWRQHYNDDLGERVLAGMELEDKLELESALADAITMQGVNDGLY